MGIPNLYSLLRPYAKPIVFSASVLEGDARPRGAMITPKGEAATAAESREPGRIFPTDKYLYIDGPALAHHVYHTALSNNYYDSLGRIRRNPFDAVVEYEDFVRAIGEFLERLEECEFEIRAIYFDGFLPAFKRPIRINRLYASLNKLLAYHSKHPTHIPSFNSSYRNAATKSKSAPSTRNLVCLPTPPFIVSTTLSYLNTSKKWGSLVQTVPGEADSWCASNALRNGGIALSGDTDLLLYGNAMDSGISAGGLNPNWGVIMFRDLSFIHETKKLEEGGGNRWLTKALIFRPREINAVLFGGVGGESAEAIAGSILSPPTHKTSAVKKKRKRRPTVIPLLEVASKEKAGRNPGTLLNLAYHLQKEPTAGLNRLKQLVKASFALPTASTKERVFCAEYELVPPTDPTAELPKGYEIIASQLLHLDPRISELVYQLPCLAVHVHPSPQSRIPAVTAANPGEMVELDMDSFLPFLYEDPTRSSAWDVGRELRQVAYLILETYQNRHEPGAGEPSCKVKLIVKEHVRRGKRMKEVIVEDEIHGNGNTSAAKGDREVLDGLVDYVRSWKGKPSGNANKGSWTCDCSKYWWVEMILEMVVREYTTKGKELPAKRELGVIVHILRGGISDEQAAEVVSRDILKSKIMEEEEKISLLEPTDAATTKGDPPHWTWPLIHLFAQVQAGIYSLWMLKQLMPFALAVDDPSQRAKLDILAELLRRVPPVEKVIAGKRFLNGFEHQRGIYESYRCDGCGFAVQDIITDVTARWTGWRLELEEEGGEAWGGGTEDEQEGVDKGSGVEEVDHGGGSRISWEGMDADF